MLKHIVMWSLKDEVEFDGQHLSKAEGAARIKQALEGLKGQIKGLLHLEVGLDINCVEGNADVVLYTEFTDQDALELYQQHPLHKAVVPLIKALCTERHAVDYQA